MNSFKMQSFRAKETKLEETEVFIFKVFATFTDKDSREKTRHYMAKKRWIGMLQAESELPFPTWAPRVNMSGSSPPGIFLNKGANTLKKDMIHFEGKSKGTTEM